MKNSIQTREKCAELVMCVCEEKGITAGTDYLETICGKWEGVDALASNLIRCANNRKIAVTIDHESGGVMIIEPVDQNEAVYRDNFEMIRLLIDHFDTLQADALCYLQMHIEMETDDTEQQEAA